MASHVRSTYPTRKTRHSVLGLAIAWLVAGLWGPTVFAGTASENERLYVEAIKAWLDEPGDEAARQLVELEVNAEGPRLERLDEAAERVINDLARLDPAALLPVAVLHRHAYDLHLEDGALRGVHHSARRFRDVLNLYTRKSRSLDADAVAGRQWTALALTLLARGGSNMGTSVACLSEGLSHLRTRKPHDGVREERIRALHIRAVVIERIGAPAKALDDLEDLLDIEPDHPEARLRRAVNLMHAGRPEDARPLFELLLEAKSIPDWIAVVAAQQLARLHLDDGDGQSGLATLRAAHARFPDNARLTTLLAYLERPEWESSKARIRSLLEERPKANTANTLRPRARYEGPLDDDAEIRRLTAEDLADHLTATRAAVLRWEERRAAN